MFKYFIIILRLFITFLQALVHWCAYESCFVVSVEVFTISLCIWDDSFPYQGMAATLAESQYSGNDARRISPEKIMLNFGAIITATIFRNRGSTPRGSTPPYVSRARSRRRRTGVQNAKELNLDRGKQDKGVEGSQLKGLKFYVIY